MKTTYTKKSIDRSKWFHLDFVSLVHFRFKDFLYSCIFNRSSKNSSWDKTFNLNLDNYANLYSLYWRLCWDHVVKCGLRKGKQLIHITLSNEQQHHVDFSMVDIVFAYVCMYITGFPLSVNIRLWKVTKINIKCL